MENIKEIVGNNLQELRKKKKLTQGELANLFNYSDKSISKWEKGDALPDIEVLYQLCEFYGVSLDYLTSTGTKKEKQKFEKEEMPFSNKITITCLVISIIWMAATIAFITPYLKEGVFFWQAFIWALPISALALLYMNFIYFKKRLITFIGATIFVWTAILAFALQFMHYNLCCIS